MEAEAEHVVGWRGARGLILGELAGQAVSSFDTERNVPPSTRGHSGGASAATERSGIQAGTL